MKVTIRKRLIEDGEKYSLRLDIYPPAPHPVTGNLTRWYNLGMYLYAQPKSSAERQQNKETMMLAQSIMAKIQLQLQAGEYGFLIKTEKDTILSFLNTQLDQNIPSYTLRDWRQLKKMLVSFFRVIHTKDLLFREFTLPMIERFKLHLLEALAPNTAANVFIRLKYLFKLAYKEKIISEHVLLHTNSLPKRRTKLVFLSHEELEKLKDTDCKNEIIKKAALFSALTGMRKSDLAKLVWEDIQQDETGFFIHFKQQKTKQVNYHPVSSSAVDLLGERGSGLVFPRLVYHLNKLCSVNAFHLWIKAAGISKPVTFHTMRHTYATLLLKANTNIKVVSAMLGHSNIQSTMIYAHVVDENRRIAADVLSL